MKKPKDLIDELLAGCKTPADIAGENGLPEPQLVAKGETRWHGFDDKILSLYARGDEWMFEVNFRQAGFTEER